MFLVDSEIREEIKKGLLMNSTEGHIGPIGYDLVSEFFIGDHKEEQASFVLSPGESVFVGAKEIVKMPNDLVGKIYLRNSRIRQGLTLDAPVYQPGHHTRVFFRITNVSKANISLHKGDGIAMMCFDKLCMAPDHSYRGEFQSEFDYNGMGKYGDQYTQQMQELEDKITSLKDLEKGLYTNMLSLMAIFFGIFSLVNVNLSAISSKWSMVQLVVCNSAIIGGISVLIGLIRILIPDLAKKKLSKVYWVLPAICFLISILLALLDVK